MRCRIAATIALVMLGGCGSPANEPWNIEKELFAKVFDIQVLAAPADGSLYAAGTLSGLPLTIDRTVCRSDDGGATWTRTILLEEKREIFERFTILAAEPSGATVYLAGLVQRPSFGPEPEGVLYRSDDRGRRWVRIVGPRGNLRLSSIAVGPRGRVYVYSCQGIHRSDDRGVTWTHTGLYRHVTSRRYPHWCHVFALGRMVVDAEGNLYAPATGPAGEGIYRSVDGEHWSRLRLPPLHHPYFLAANRTNGVAALGWTENGPRLFFSADAGNAWDEVELPEAAARLGVSQLALGPESELYVEARHGFFEEGGLFRSRDLGASWQRLSKLPTPFWPATKTPLVVDRDGILYVGVGIEQGKSSLGMARGSILVSRDQGETWETLRVLERLREAG